MTMMEMEERATNRPRPVACSYVFFVVSSKKTNQLQLALRTNGYKNGFLVKRSTFSNPGREKEGKNANLYIYVLIYICVRSYFVSRHLVVLGMHPPALPPPRGPQTDLVRWPVPTSSLSSEGKRQINSSTCFANQRI